MTFIVTTRQLQLSSIMLSVSSLKVNSTDYFNKQFCAEIILYMKKKIQIKKNKTIVLIKRHRDTASYFYLINKILSYDL